MEKVYVIESAGVTLPAGEYLVEVTEEGVLTIAYREKQWHSWGPPVEAETRPG